MATPIDLATRQQVYLERLKAGYVRNWRGVQASLRERVRAVLGALEADNLQDLDRRELQKALIKLRGAMVEVTAPAMTDFLRQMPGLAEYSARFEVANLRTIASPFPLPAISSAALRFERDGMRDKSIDYWRGQFAEAKDPNALARTIKPIVVTKDIDPETGRAVYTLQDGRHRLTEAERAGATEINATFIEYDASGQNRILQVTKVVKIGELAMPAIRFNTPTAKLAYQAAVENPIQATGEMLFPFVNEWPERDALRVANIVQRGWAQGRTVSEMVREVVGTKAAGYADGVLEVSRQHAATVIQTATQHVANAARMEVWESNSDLVKQYQWLSTLDRRTTAQCKSLDGKRFEPGKGPMPPIHPNCRSTTVAVLSSEFDFLDEGATRASGGPNPGYAPADENYFDWLKRQPADFQDAALGPSRAKLFRDGGLTAERFAELNIGRDFEALTLEEMRQIEPGAFAKAGL
jgi:SPP1 gp7 family putative phage head morphogenesis protein